MAKKKKKYPPALVPHASVNYYGEDIAVVRVPAGTKPADRQEAINKNKQLGRKMSRKYINEWDNWS